MLVALRKETHNEMLFMRIAHKAFKLLLNTDCCMIITKHTILFKS